MPGMLVDGVLTGQREIYYGSQTVVWPEETVSVWSVHVSEVLEVWAAEQTASATATVSATATKTETVSSSAHKATATSAAFNHYRD